MWTDLSTVLSQYTRVTDRRTEFSSQYIHRGKMIHTSSKISTKYTILCKQCKW